MTLLMPLGFFRELRHGDPDGPSLEELAGAGNAADTDMLVAYLRDGAALIVSPGLVSDVLSGDETPVCERHIVTDGVWVWPLDVAHYVEKRDVGLPLEFLEHVQRVSYKIPHISNEQLSALAQRGW